MSGGGATQFEWTDLHHMLSDPDTCSEDEVLATIEQHPEQARLQHAVRGIAAPACSHTRSVLAPEQGSFLPAHFAAAFFGSKAVCERLHEVYPEGTRARSQIGSLPLHLAAHNGRLEAVRTLWAAFPEGAEAEDGWGFTPVDLAWRKGHWEVVDFLESRTSLAPKEATSSGEVIAPYDPTTPLEAHIFREKYAHVLDEVDPVSAEGYSGPDLLPEDASGLPRPGDPDFAHQAEYEEQQERWRQAVANVPERLALESWIARHPDSFLARKVARDPGLLAEWRQQIRRYVDWMRAQGADPAVALAEIREATRLRDEEKARQRAELLRRMPDEDPVGSRQKGGELPVG